MMYCEKCGLSVRGEYSHCPLCQQTLAGEPEQSVFPVIHLREQRLKMILRLAAFASVVSIVLSLALNLAFPAYGWWAVFVIAGLASLWISMGILIQNIDNIIKAMVWQVVIISALAVAWDIFTGFRGWSVDFVIPMLCTASIAAMAIFAQATRLKIEDYVIYLVIDSVWGLLCVLLIVFDVSKIIWPCLICVACSVISLSALFIFEGRALNSELRRRLHL